MPLKVELHDGEPDGSETTKPLSSASDVDGLKRDRERILRSLLRTDAFLAEYSSEDFAEVAPRVELLNERWKEFQEIARKIEALERDEENDRLFDDTEDKVVRMKGQLMRKLSEVGETARVKQEQDNSMSSACRLPRLTLPEFSGKYDEWLPYHDMFVVTIHENEKLSSVEKMLYLKRSLKGEALKVVDALPACNANYEVAWAALKKRYANEYILKKRHVNAMLQFPRLKVLNTAGIHGVIECFERNLSILNQLGENTEEWGILLIQILVSKLDEHTQQKWERHVEENDAKSVQDLLSFLRTQTRIMDAFAVDKPTAGGKVSGEHHVASNVASEVKCVKCDGSHLLENCEYFRMLAVVQRRELIDVKRLCANCLKPGHFQAKCWSRTRCHTCNRKHHSLLHVDDRNGSTSKMAQDEPSPRAVVSTSAKENFKAVFLSTAVVNVRTRTNKWLPARALLDSGSQVNLMSKGLLTRLKLPCKTTSASLSGVGKCEVSIQGSVTTDIHSTNSEYKARMQFLILPKITAYKPTGSGRIDRQELPRNFVLADPDFDANGEIDLLLGSEFYADFLMADSNGRLRVSFSRLPAFINTVFGWVAVGQVPLRDEQQSIQQITCGSCTRLEDLIERFWAIEEIHNAPSQSQEEKDCESHFTQTHQRDGEGRYIVKLPFKVSLHGQLGSSEVAARKRFLQLERRFERDEHLKKEYSAVISDYINKGFLTEVKVKRDNRDHFYLPHHPVIKSSSVSTKVRPVFDGSAQTDSGKSLNDLLMTGPVMQDNLLVLLLRFRMRPVVLVADIKQMYLQVKVHSDHTPFQRILWRSSSDQPIGIYELQRVTFGLAPSSFLAIRVLHQLAFDEGMNFPLAKPALLEDFYVDDYIGGASSEDEAIRLQAELSTLLGRGGFHLTKWNSNKKSVLSNVPADDLGDTKVKMFGAPEEPFKALGIAWLPEADELFIDSNLQVSDDWTRRKVYSLVARIYDPLGLVAPVTAWAKINMQLLWLATNSWDEDIPTSMQEKWCAFQSQLVLLKNIKFPRHCCVTNPITLQLHCFSDASEAAYGACVYLRSIDSSGNIMVHLLAAKSRPAPLKKISLARLELCGALLGAKLQKVVRQALKLSDIETFMWTDSTIVLHWIRSPSYSWATYVANRVSEIQELTHGYKWMHIKGIENPSDIVSRGAMPNELLSSKLWFAGPAWLQLPEEQWNISRAMESPQEECLERRKSAVVAGVSREADDWCEKFSSYEKLLRITAYCLRFLKQCQRKSNHPSRVLLLSELTEAKVILVKREQRIHFASEIKELRAGRPVRPKSTLKTLGVFLDSDGMLRVGGRLSRGRQMLQKPNHPWAMPKRSFVSRLIAEYYHRITMHGGPTMTLSSMRREYWAVQGRSLVNSVCRRCPACYRMNPPLVQQPPGQLPVARMTAARPFSIVGVDFCGPIYLKPVHRRAAAEKAYIAIFVCFSVKAVHIELVESLSTEAFLASFRRFVARRGMPGEVYSDNGLNFQGGRKVVDEYFAMLHSDSSINHISKYAVDSGVKWHFIPPHAPNFGGLWEAAVKATKRVLMKVLGCRRLSYGEMATVLAQVEAQLNSRPLTPLSEDPEELDVLTPGHFLIGAPINALPEPSVVEVPANRLRGYEVLRQIIQNHWIRWRAEYFNELHNEHQRRMPVVQLEVGQMVLLKEDGKIPHHWPLGRITQVFPGPDGIVRVVEVKTKGGVYRRPACKINLLPFERTV